MGHKIMKNPYENIGNPINNQDCTIKQQRDFKNHQSNILQIILSA